MLCSMASVQGFRMIRLLAVLERIDRFYSCQWHLGLWQSGGQSRDTCWALRGAWFFLRLWQRWTAKSFSWGPFVELEDHSESKRKGVGSRLVCAGGYPLLKSRRHARSAPQKEFFTSWSPIFSGTAIRAVCPLRPVPYLRPDSLSSRSSKSLDQFQLGSTWTSLFFVGYPFFGVVCKGKTKGPNVK